MLLEGDRRRPTKLPIDLGSGPLAELAPRTSFWKGAVIGRQGEPCNNLHIIAEGHVLLSRVSPDGSQHVLYLLGPGELFGEGSLQPNGSWLVTARAITDGATHVIPAVHLPRFGQYYPELVGYVATLLSKRLERAHRRLDVATANSARERLLGLLHLMAEHLGQPRGEEIWLPLTLTQSDIGSMVGLARETVARVMGALENEELIRRRGRRGLWLRKKIVPERDALATS